MTRLAVHVLLDAEARPVLFQAHTDKGHEFRAEFVTFPVGFNPLLRHSHHVEEPPFEAVKRSGAQRAERFDCYGGAYRIRVAFTEWLDLVGLGYYLTLVQPVGRWHAGSAELLLEAAKDPRRTNGVNYLRYATGGDQDAAAAFADREKRLTFLK